MRTISELAREAILVQDACNPLGLTKSFAKVTQELAGWLSAHAQGGTDAICNHPVFRLWASKLHDLARMGLSDTERYGRAYSECRKLAGERP